MSWFSFGSTTTLNATTIVEEAINTVISTSTASCSSNVSTSQMINVSHLNLKGCSLDIGGFNQSTLVMPTTKCFQANTKSIDLQTSFKQAIKQQIDKETTSNYFSISTNTTQNINDMVDRVVDTIDLFDSLNCATTSISNQIITVGYINLECTDSNKQVNIHDLSQMLVNKQMLECIQKNTATVNAITDLQTALDQATKEKEAASIKSTIIAIIVLIVLLLLIYVYFKFFRR
jgi:hypothetical protein